MKTIKIETGGIYETWLIETPWGSVNIQPDMIDSRGRHYDLIEVMANPSNSAGSASVVTECVNERGRVKETERNAYTLKIRSNG